MGSVGGNIWRVMLYKLVSDFWLVVPVLIPYYQSKDISATGVFLIQAFYSVGLILFEVPSGYFSDVLGRRRTLIIGSAFLPLGLTLYAFSSTTPMFCLAEILLAVGGSMRSGTDSAIIYDSLAQLDQVERYQSMESMAELSARLGGAGSAVLGGLLGMGMLELPFYINIFTSGLLLVLALGLTEPKRLTPVPENPLRGILQIAGKCIRDRGTVPLMLMSSLIVNTGIIGIWAFFLYFAKLDVSVGYLGLIFAVFQLTSGLGARLNTPITRLLGRAAPVILSGAVALPMVVMALVTTPLAIPMVLFTAASMGLAVPTILDALNRRTGSDTRATVLSLSSLFGRIHYIILSPVIGWIIDRWDLSTGFLVLAGVFFLGFGLLGLRIRATRGLAV